MEYLNIQETVIHWELYLLALSLHQVARLVSCDTRKGEMQNGLANMVSNCAHYASCIYGTAILATMQYNQENHGTESCDPGENRA